MKKKLLAYLLFLFPLVAFAGHAHAETIKVVFDTAYAPFEFKDSDQTYKGIDVEILDKVAEINGWDLDKSFPGFDAAVNAVQAGQADAIMAGMTKTTEREKVFTMSDTYYDTKVVIATKKADKITKYSQLKGKTVGVKNGTAAQRFLDKNKDKMCIRDRDKGIFFHPLAIAVAKDRIKVLFIETDHFKLVAI